jgi:hypothetical protein
MTALVLMMLVIAILSGLVTMWPALQALSGT